MRVFSLQMLGTFGSERADMFCFLMYMVQTTAVERTRVEICHLSMTLDGMILSLSFMLIEKEPSKGDDPELASMPSALEQNLETPHGGEHRAVCVCPEDRGQKVPMDNLQPKSALASVLESQQGALSTS